MTRVRRGGDSLGQGSFCVRSLVDALSRLPIHPSRVESTPVPGNWTYLVNFLDSSPVTSSHVRENTRKDLILSRVFRFCESGWSAAPRGDSDFTPYLRRKNELSLQNGCILWGSRVIIPVKLRTILLQELHAGLTGSSRMKELARSYVWWPNLDTDLKNMTRSCPDCLAQRAPPPKAELHPWEWPTHPWHRLHVDYADPVSGRYFLIIVDGHSKWLDIYVTPRKLSSVYVTRSSSLNFPSLLSLIMALVSHHRSSRPLRTTVVSGTLRQQFLSSLLMDRQKRWFKSSRKLCIPPLCIIYYILLTLVLS